jgi:prevent-host-death family protein
VKTNGHKIVVMPKKTAAGTRRAKRATGAPSVAAAEFKARCLELMDRVRETGVEYVITKHGRPVAKLVPVVQQKRASSFGSMSGTVLEYDRPLDPLDDDYDVNRG